MKEVWELPPGHGNFRFRQFDRALRLSPSASLGLRQNRAGFLEKRAKRRPPANHTYGLTNRSCRCPNEITSHGTGAVWKRRQNEVREYPERFAKFAMCFPSGIHLFS